MPGEIRLLFPAFLREEKQIVQGRTGGERILAKETMQAVNEAEKAARQAVLCAKEEGERLVKEAEAQSKKLLADAEKEAAKRVEVLCGVARADGEKQKARSLQETGEEQSRLKEYSAAALPQAADEIKKIIFGQAERR